MSARIPVEPGTRDLPAIERPPEAGPFQAAALAGRLVVPRCRECGRAHWHPRPFCPHCHGQNIDWAEASGLGTVYTYTVMRRAKPVYVMAYVRLDEGATMMTHIVGCPPDDVRIGLRVQAVFNAAPGGVLVPVFRPLA